MTRAAIVAIASMALPLAVVAQQPDAPRIYPAIVLDRRSPAERTLAQRIARLDAALAVKVTGEPPDGGDATWKDGRAIGRNGPPPLRVGETYVVMLSSTRVEATMYAHTTDIFRLVRGRLVAHGAAPLGWPFAQEVLNLPWRDALAAFRAAASEAESLN